MNVVKCSSCGAPIFFVTMRKSGGSMPLDIQPQKLVQVVDEAGEMVEVYTPHWATCPSASKHRRPKSTAGVGARPANRPASPPAPSLPSGASAGPQTAPIGGDT